MKSTQHVWVIFRKRQVSRFFLALGGIHQPASNKMPSWLTIAAWAWWDQTNRTFSANPICVEHEQAIGRIRKNKNPKTWPLVTRHACAKNVVPVGKTCWYIIRPPNALKPASMESRVARRTQDGNHKRLRKKLSVWKNFGLCCPCEWICTAE